MTKTNLERRELQEALCTQPKENRTDEDDHTTSAMLRDMGCTQAADRQNEHREGHREGHRNKTWSSISGSIRGLSWPAPLV